MTFRIVLTMWAMYGWSAEIIDSETAFLYGDLEEEIYLKKTEGYSEYKGEHFERKCVLLQHVIYGMVHGARKYFKN